MYGALIVAHDVLAMNFLKILEKIVGDVEGFEGVTINWADDHENGIKKVEKALDKLKNYDGIIIFTDMFGGTPTNISLPFLEEGRVEIITGVNLPMLIKFANMRNDSSQSFNAVIEGVKERAQQSIKVPGQIYYQKKKA